MIYKFKCPYCKKEFEHRVNTTGTDKKGKQSNQCRCPQCGNFLKNDLGN